ncbi:cupin [Drepanopeziza brunnea f. sp. 'multigermtubi' MB_m1]|uniref:Cupin n=1 Tax=Marssonina brunnea f. sp. multigermtubi (strain MB_m1) TaxID=1072389 RepID=K1WR74_MARBU|nr:cupin [Drepanopeziza brunnea f. sp. 'multigermtubi' MB_m1]EKD14897.1 cupin [Drepanopeziza brunnea f. sp. 'multigermtubi' MB_m1]
MFSNSIIALAIVASCTVAANTSSCGSPASTPAAGAPGELSLTQKLFLADTAADRFGLLTDEQFRFPFGDPAKKGQGGKGGDLIAANRKTFPALVGSGSGMSVGFLGPCGFNTPHVHPRATELQIVTQGRLEVEMVPENGVFKVPGNKTSGRRVIKNSLDTFDMTPFYMGSVHAQYNPDCTEAVFVAAFNSEDAGTGPVLDETFQFSANLVSAAFGQAIDGSDVDQFKSQIPASIAMGVEECLTKCNLKKRSI